LWLVYVAISLEKNSRDTDIWDTEHYFEQKQLDPILSPVKNQVFDFLRFSAPVDLIDNMSYDQFSSLFSRIYLSNILNYYEDLYWIDEIKVKVKNETSLKSINRETSDPFDQVYSYNEWESKSTLNKEILEIFNNVESNAIANRYWSEIFSKYDINYKNESIVYAKFFKMVLTYLLYLTLCLTSIMIIYYKWFIYIVYWSRKE